PRGIDAMTTMSKAVLSKATQIGAGLAVSVCLTTPLTSCASGDGPVEATSGQLVSAAPPFFFSAGNPDGRLGALSRPPSPQGLETETADDFLLAETTVISHATIFGLLPAGTPVDNITNVEVEVYHIFAVDSDVGRTSGPPTFSVLPNIPTRVNSP